jgi:hypothetical protein
MREGEILRGILKERKILREEHMEEREILRKTPLTLGAFEGGFSCCCFV